MSTTHPAAGHELTEHLRHELQSLLHQAQAKIHHCVGQLADEQLWWRPAPEMNSIANLILHIGGNLQQWVVDGVPAHANSRDRPAEFAATGGVQRGELLRRLDRVVDAAVSTIAKIADADWLSPRTVQEFNVTVLGLTAHSVPHFVGHTHQIVQLTRMQLGANYQMHWQPSDDRGTVPI